MANIITIKTIKRRSKALKKCSVLLAGAIFQFANGLEFINRSDETLYIRMK